MPRTPCTPCSPRSPLSPFSPLSCALSAGVRSSTSITSLVAKAPRLTYDVPVQLPPAPTCSPRASARIFTTANTSSVVSSLTVLPLSSSRSGIPTSTFPFSSGVRPLTEITGSFGAGGMPCGGITQGVPLGERRPGHCGTVCPPHFRLAGMFVQDSFCSASSPGTAHIIAYLPGASQRATIAEPAVRNRPPRSPILSRQRACADGSAHRSCSW